MTSRWLPRVWHMTVAILVALAAWHFIDFQRLFSTMAGADPALLALCFLLVTLDRFLMAAKWLHLMRAIDVPAGFRITLSAYYQAAFIGRIVPTSLSGDILRGYVVSRETRQSDRVLGSMVVEKFTAIAGSVLLASVGTAVLWREIDQQDAQFVIWLVPLTMVLLLSGFHLSMSRNKARWLARLVPWRKPRAFLKKAHRAYCMYQSQRTTLVTNLVLSVGEQALQIGYICLCAIAIGINANSWTLIGALAISQLLRKIAIVFEGWALGEFILVLTCALAGLDQTEVLTFSLLSHAVAIVATLPGAILVVRGRRATAVAVD